MSTYSAYQERARRDRQEAAYKEACGSAALARQMREAATKHPCCWEPKDSPHHPLCPPLPRYELAAIEAQDRLDSLEGDLELARDAVDDAEREVIDARRQAEKLEDAVAALREAAESSPGADPVITETTEEAGNPHDD